MNKPTTSESHKTNTNHDKSVHHTTHHPHKPTTHDTDNRLLINVLLLALTFFVLLNFYFVYQMRGVATMGTPPAAPAPLVELTILTATDCADCFSIDPVVASVKSRKLNITSEKNLSWKDPEGAALLSKHGITRAPALIVSGEIEDVTIDGLLPSPSQDALVFTMTPPPFVLVADGSIAGRATLTVIDAKECKTCYNITSVINQIQSTIIVTKTENLHYKDAAAKKLISTYNISKVPAVILSKDAELYTIVNRSWDQLGTRETDGSLVLRNTPPPYLDPATGAVKGLVTLTFVTDKACSSCYNVSIHREVLKSIGIGVSKEMSVDAGTSAGRDLINKLNITGVPTVVLSKDAGAYPLFTQIWPQVGTEESDGSYVFRAFDALGDVTWKEVATGKLKGVPTLVVNTTSNTTTEMDSNDAPKPTTA